jgi:hypothetical protein
MAETLPTKDMLPNKFQPKVKTRWLLAIEGVDSFLCKTAARPQMTTEEIEIPWMNSRRYIAGVTKFAPMNVTIHDPVAPSGAQQIMEWIRLCFESVSGRAGYADFYKRDIQLKLVDPIGTVVELWDIKGAWVQDATFGELTYEDSGSPVEVALVIRFDMAVLQY